MNTNGIRTNMEAVMNGLLNGSTDPTTAHEVANAAGKFLDACKVDLAGEALRLKVAGFKHEAIALSELKVIDAE